MKLGVCYYPEHWPESDWDADLDSMKAAGISQVRIGEFAWSRLEPQPGTFDWRWLDLIIEKLAVAGLEIVLCTPTATPPKWLIDRNPDILPRDENGHVRNFGSRRHYCFSSATYRAESARIVEALARRYGAHPAVVMWQTDNEYGHHGSDESFSNDARYAFRQWLLDRYVSVEKLNLAWGTVFWSQTYASFGEIDPPAATVTEANPSHRLDWRRFCSHQIVTFNQEQVDIIREFSPGTAITHNFIGDFFRLDHRGISRSLDIATWDSYPIGLLSEGTSSDEDKLHWLRAGHPDFASFNHDVFRACTPRWGVMEQQPGAVNWATYNAAPAPGMVRLWTWEAFAHGAEFVSYFRWRQLPFGQEQMHAGLLAPDRAKQPVMGEIKKWAAERSLIGDLKQQAANVAILMDYPSLWAHEIQPQGNMAGPLALTQAAYSACRQLGLNVDFVFQDSELSGYRMIIVPSAPILSDEFCQKLADCGAHIVATARSGSRTEEGHLTGQKSGALYRSLGLRVDGLETLPLSAQFEVKGDNWICQAGQWRETISTNAACVAEFENGEPAWVRRGQSHYLACWPSEALWRQVLVTVCDTASIAVAEMGRDVRVRRTGDIVFAFNYGSVPVDLLKRGAPVEQSRFLLGGPSLNAFDVAAWRLSLDSPE